MKIGIPKALFFYDYLPFFETFLKKLGFEVIVFEKTSQKVLEKGKELLSDEVCLPMKILAGKVWFLRDKVDFIFLPSIHSENKKEFFCAKYIGLPDLIKNRVFPNILEIKIDSFEKKDLFLNLFSLFKKFGKKKGEIDFALKEAFLAQKNNEIKEKNLKGGNFVGVVGHSYFLEDEFLVGRILKILKEKKIEVLFPKNISKKDKENALLKINPSPYFGSEKEILGSLSYMAKKGASGIIFITSFLCGPDSLMVEVGKRFLKKIKIPFLHLVLDETTGFAGTETRVEAFLDFLKEKKEKKEIFSFLGPSFLRHKERKIVLPNPGGKLSVLRNLFYEKFGMELILPKVTQRTIEIGAKLSPDDVCLPFKVILGSFYEGLEKGGKVLGMIISQNACRMGYFFRVQQRILKDLGFEFETLSLSPQEKSLRGFISWLKKIFGDFPLKEILEAIILGAKKLQLIDEIERKVQKIRPFEKKEGLADKIYERSFEEIDKAKNIFELYSLKKEIFKKLEKIEKKETQALKIGICGELFVVFEPACNFFLEKELGKRGVIVERIKSGFLSEYTKFFQFDLLNKEKKRLQKYTKNYLKYDVGGHGLESLGKKIELQKRGFDGMVHLMPFGCLPETVAENIMTKIEGLPTLTLFCDEKFSSEHFITRIEAFLDMLSSKKYKKNI